jgi:hypothetical protein
MKMRNTVFAIVAVSLLAGCAGSPSVSSQSLSYPYVATPNRQDQILNGMGRVKADMDPSDVERFLGKPDEIRKLYDRIKNADPVGYTWWYIIERHTPSGSVVEKAEKLVRVSFDLKDKVTRVDSWGIETKSDNN